MILVPAKKPTFILGAFVLSLNVVAKGSINDCVDLTPYATDTKSLEVLLKGDVVHNNGPLIFNVPSQYVNDTATYCLEEIPIPHSVDGRTCLDDDDTETSCWLVVNTYVVEDGFFSLCDDNKEECTGGYGCVCAGGWMRDDRPFSAVSFGDGPIVAYPHNSCVSSKLNEWTTTCIAAYQGLNLTVTGALITVCPNIPHMDICGNCSEGMAPGLGIGITWTNDQLTGCGNLFGSSAPRGGRFWISLLLTLAATVVVATAASLDLML
ncbi:hypothetical protein IV203_029956 [Nitzschia inconspicua]|uniref:Uncharacterized protein n=1 Tax=Nitzschia inconspicua TaxID=303405 RepID=A0A9K3Q1P7_9STRA|nr:hypothetical protein IV203_029956 [Nitzschia inconspicua]